jgi:hypothetical protein
MGNYLDFESPAKSYLTSQLVAKQAGGNVCRHSALRGFAPLRLGVKTER